VRRQRATPRAARRLLEAYAQPAAVDGTEQLLLERRGEERRHQHQAQRLRSVGRGEGVSVGVGVWE